MKKEENLDYTNPNLTIISADVVPGKIAWRSPSNLALVKYWGKHGRQLPQNPSISFTLENAYTETTLSYKAKVGADEGMALEFYFKNEKNEAFKSKVLKFLESITDIFPFLKQLDLTIHSDNSFPHSAGIASSASSMGALALCLCSLEHRLLGTLANDVEFRRKASFVARLGSGSASRSIYDVAAIWGYSLEAENSSDLYAIPAKDKLHEIFKTYHDDILIVNKNEKSVSSRMGHGLMVGNIYAENRYKQAKARFRDLMSALKTGDLEAFGNITENEAMTLHALMMTSNPSFTLMRPNTLLLIEMVRDFREKENVPVYFSLDAGPNLHLLYPHSFQEKVQGFIGAELSKFCEQGEWIKDQVGAGPLEL